MYQAYIEHQLTAHSLNDERTMYVLVLYFSTFKKYLTPCLVKNGEYDIELYSNIHHICSIDNMHVKVIILLRHYFPMRRKQNNDTTLYG